MGMCKNAKYHDFLFPYIILSNAKDLKSISMRNLHCIQNNTVGFLHTP